MANGCGGSSAVWDDDRIEVKSRIKVAAAMLRGHIDGSAEDGNHAATPSDKGGLAPWPPRKVKDSSTRHRTPRSGCGIVLARPI
jgi:hypothetical protein